MADKPKSASPSLGQAVLKILLDRGTINRDLYEGALNRFKAYGGHAEEIILDMGGIDEKTLLNVLANHYGTKFVLSDKLKAARFKDDLLGIIPDKVIRAHEVFPISWDPASLTLSILISNPTNVPALQEVEQTSQARKVVLFLARPAAIQAAIARWYDEDEQAFDKLSRDDVQAYQQMMDVYERNVIDTAAGKAGNEFTAEDIARKTEPTRPAADAADASFASGESFLTTLHIMMGLVENERGDLRGHSVAVSRAARQMAERVRMARADVVAIAIAGAIHDLGKFGLFHLTALNVAEWEGHWEAAAARHTLPSRLFETVHLPAAAHQTMDSMYERFDGSGFPQGLKSKDIPIGARILAIVDTFSDLTLNPKNPYRRVLTPEEARQVLEKYKGKIFDPMLVDVYSTLVAGGALRDSLLAGQHSILIVEPDPEQALILELNLVSRGFSVYACSTTKAAMETLVGKGTDLVISEVDVKPIDGFDFVARIRADQRFKDLPVIFYTSRSDQKDVSRGFELGAADYVVKPSSVDVVAAKVTRSLQAGTQRAVPAAAGGVSGSLKEMDLPDLVQVLSQGRKTGSLKITGPQGDGEIHFLEGKLVNALFGGQEGSEAFYAMLKLSDGQFQVDPKFRPSRQTIQMSAESLLLEGMRRLDESNR